MTGTYVAEPVPTPRGEHLESPVWDERTSELLWVDQHAGLVHVAHAPTHRLVQAPRTYSVPGPVGCVVPVASVNAGWMAASAGAFMHLRRNGAHAIVEVVEHAGRARMNDGKCDPAGRFWAGSMAVDCSAGGGSLFRLGLDGQARAVFTGVGISNGLAWADGGQRLYYIDSLTGGVDVVDLDSDGFPVNRRPAFAVDPASGSPDGMCIDDDGMLWVALWGGAAVRRYAPDGTMLAHVEVAAPQVTSCAFGGADRRTLFITTSREGYSLAAAAAWPYAGCLFAVELPVGGPAPSCYAGPLPTPEGAHRVLS